jgi:membrane protease YdiL (CAAX protease family)
MFVDHPIESECEEGKVMKRNIHVRLAAIVFVWYLIAVAPLIFIDNCRDGTCDSAGEMLSTALLPLLGVLFTIGVAMAFRRESLPAALARLGVSRVSGRSVWLALLLTSPLVLFFPAVAAITGEPLTLAAYWPWLVLSIALTNGISEETMLRGLIFGHMRETRTFWKAALISTAYFAGVHVPLVVFNGWLIGGIAILVAVPTSFLFAYLYEQGGNTIWGSAVAHTIINAMGMLFVFSDETTGVSGLLYLVLTILVTAPFMVSAYRRRHSVRDGETIEATPAVRRDSEPLSA